ncbi:ORF6C domain-containing protein [Clostridium gasigenes]|uniref:ORF6C domain-containing protein n=1 Tax=Clostridium gasigenes TaxID=94869 RepID=UPI001C0AC504|nr:ORF6C domain-containing protein [Clostridium gasigenes]MBU3102962.1 ORF6C domain-containing protein [Clostridium gasigenes]
MNKLVPVEFKKQRIITTKIMAESFRTEDKIISNNFNRNTNRFTEGKHYYKLDGEELKTFKTNHLNDEPSMLRVNCLYLWTERGVARHAKILDTDEAWEVYEELEENYFKAQGSKQLSPMDQLKLQYQVLEVHEEKLNEVSQKVIYLEGSMTIDHGQAVNIKLAVDLKVRRLCCGSESNAYLNKELKSKIYRFVWKSIKEYFNVTAYHNLLRKDMEEAIKYISNLTLQGGILREVQQENSQMCLEV